MESILRSHKLGYFEILDHSWSIFRQGIKYFLIILVVLQIPLTIFTYYITASMTYNNDEEIVRSLGLCCLLYILIYGLSSLMFVAEAYVVEGIVQNRAIRLADIIRFSFSRLPIFFTVYILLMLAIFIGTMLLIIPGIILGIFLLFTPAVVALRHTGFPAFQYSIDLVKGQWWRILGLSIGMAIPLLISYFVINFIVNNFFSASTIASILGSLITSLIAVIYAIFILVLFLNEDYLRHPVSQPATELEQQEY